MEINAGFIIWAVISLAAILVLLASLRQDAPKQHRAVEVYVPEGAAQPAAPVVEVVEPVDTETRHWIAQGMRKLGYSAHEAKRMADDVPAGYTLQEGIEYCLYKRGKK